MIRKMTAADRSLFLDMVDEFYHSSAVLHSIPAAHYERTMRQIEGDSPYVAAYIIEHENAPAGYALLSITYSNEAGGLAVWIEELYIRPDFQGKRLGSEFLAFVEEAYPDAARIRLEIEPDNDGARRLYERHGYEALTYSQMVKEKEV